jgi:quercetin dioxygenase-like cupin family protein
MPSVIRRDRSRRTETPNAVMTTLASPTLGGSAGLSLWRVEMAAGSRGPHHVVDSEQLWTVASGEVGVTVAGVATELGPADTLVLPAGVERQIAARTDAEMVVCGHGAAVVAVPGEDAPRGTPGWIA